MSGGKSVGSKHTKASHQRGLVKLSAKNEKLIDIRHEQIIEGACRLFFKKGFHPTTIREIAQECGMSMGKLYHYISSKDDVLFLVNKYIAMKWYENIERSGVEKIKDPLKLLEIALRRTIEFITKNKKLLLFVYTESKYMEKRYLHEVLSLDDKLIVGFWRQVLEKAYKKKKIKIDKDFLANLIAFLTVFLALRGWNLKKRSNKKNIDFLMDFILRGLGIFESK
jgi:AcrR family transcriptional regulator